MTEKLLRGRILNFEREPLSGEDSSAWVYLEDGGLLIRDGIIADIGPFAQIQAKVHDVPVIDHHPHLLMAGFVDTHIHFPQVQVIASWGAQLLDWLNTYTFPSETRYSDPAHATAMARAFFDQLISHGTTSAVAFCSVHKTSTEAFFPRPQDATCVCWVARY